MGFGMNKLRGNQSNKSATCPADEAAKAYLYERAKLNRILKDTIHDDCLSDAMIYQGRARDEISAQMQKAVLQAVATSGAGSAGTDLAASAAAVSPSIPLIVISESLGSKVAFDAIYKLATSANPTVRAAGLRTFDRTTQIFMGANQLPILALADRKLDGTIGIRSEDGGYPEDPIAELIKSRAQGLRASESLALQVAAFADPNDLLSFALARRPYALNARYPVVDVIVSNDKTYFGLAELPTTAHLGYRQNDAVRALIACGNPKSKACQK